MEQKDKTRIVKSIDNTIETLEKMVEEGQNAGSPVFIARLKCHIFPGHPTHEAIGD